MSFAAALLLSVSALGQSQLSSPGVSLELTKEEAVKGNMPSPLIEGQIGCTSDGSVVIHSLLLTDSRAKRSPINPSVLNVVSMTTGDVRAFDLSKADDIEPVTDFRSFDAGRDVLFLVYSAPKLAQSGAGSRGLRLLRFDRDGVYHGSRELSWPGFEAKQIAGFDNGDLLVFGVDTKQQKPALAHVSGIGGKMFFYRPDESFAEVNVSAGAPFLKGTHPGAEREREAAVSGAVQLSQFSHFRDSILLLQLNAGAPLFQVFGNGSIRAIPLPKEDGFSADSILPSVDRIYIRYRRVGTSNGRGNDAFILQLSDEGEPVAKFMPSGFTMWDAVCARGGKFNVVKLKGESEFDFYTAMPSTGP